MFILECSGNSNRLSSNNRLSLENTSCLNNVPDYDDCATNKSENVRLFNEVYHRDSLEYHQEELFSKCINYFRLLSNSAKLMKLPQAPASQFNLHSNYIELRKSLVMFFNCIRENLEENITHIKNSYKATVINFKDQLFTFRLLLGKMDKLPDFVLQNYHTESGNQSSLASFHLFHLYLELYWLLFSIMLQYKSAAELNNENLLESEEMCTQDIFSDLNEKFDMQITQEIEWFLYNLISVSSRCYDLKGSKGIFSCNCIKDVWCSLINSINKLANINKCAGFWEYYNNIIFKYILNFEEVPIDKCNNINNLFVMNNIKSNKRLEFSLGLLSKVVKVLDENDKNSDLHENTKPNFVILEAILNKISKTDETIPEIGMRDMMKQIINITNVWTEPKSEIVMLLWEYFHKRLNSAFSTSGQNGLDVQKNFFNSSINEIIVDLNFHLSTADLSKNSIKYENSFSLFLSLLGMHMKRSISMQQPAYCQKVKGRILPKFNLNKVVSLNEFGLKHFSFLFLILAKASDANMCDKLQDLIVKLPFDNLPLNKKQIIIKTHLIILHVYIEDGKSIAKAASPLKIIMNKLSNLRDSDSMNLVKVTLNDYLEILNTSSGFQHDEHILIDNWISKYLTVCNMSDLYNVLDMLCTVLYKIRLLHSYDMNIDVSVSTLVGTFFEHIYTTVKSLFSKGSPALQVANLAFEFVKFVLENDSVSKQHGDFQSMLKYFINTEGANNRVVRHFLCKLLQDDDVLKSVEGQNKECQTLLINCWVKCSLLFGEEVSDDDTHLMLLINQLDEFSKLNITPGYGDGEQKNLCKFLYALGQVWTTLQSDLERKNFKEKVSQYLNNIEKEIIPIIKSPSSIQRITHLFVALGSLFIHCSRIIYARGDPLCLLHRLVNMIILPPHVFMGKKHHPHVSSGICRSWYMFMRGIHNLDHKSDMYVEKVMKDMIAQYLPHFVEKVFGRDVPFNVTHKMFPHISEDLLLEKYILEKISVMFITCTGKQTHANSAMALCIILDMCNTNDVNLILIIISCTLLSIFEQMMFSDTSQPNRKISEQILKKICNLPSQDVDIRQEIVDALVKACQKHLAFNSVAFFKLVSGLVALLGNQLMTSFLSKLKTEVVKIEKMRSVGFDQGLRKGIRDIESQIQEYR